MDNYKICKREFFMKVQRLLGACLFFAVMVLMGTSLSYAEDGVKDNEIILGSSLALEGHLSFLGTQLNHGALAYINSVNEKGGVNGRMIKVITSNDNYDPATCETNTRKFIEQDKVFALFNYLGTPTTLKALPTIEKAHIPLFALFTGAEVFRQPVIKEVFNVRCSSNQETQAIITKFWNDFGIRKFAVFYQDDSYGQSGLKAAEIALEKYGSKPVATGGYKTGTIMITDALNTIRASAPEAVIMAGTYTPAANFVMSAKWSNFDPYFHSLSFVGAEEFAKLIGTGRDSDGVIVTQGVPPPSSTTPAVLEYHDLLKKYYPADGPNFVSLEGFINAKVLVAILNKMGSNITREAFIKTAEGQKNLDVGLDHTITFDPSNHQGSDKVYMTVVKKGEYHLVTDDDVKFMKKQKTLH
jgi:branched-chain amino acid transport system substrate-binding protein